MEAKLEFGERGVLGIQSSGIGNHYVKERTNDRVQQLERVFRIVGRDRWQYFLQVEPFFKKLWGMGLQ